MLTHSIRFEGQVRDALLYLPTHTNRRGGVPLVLVFHGGASTPASIARMSAMHRLGEQKGFAVAYPFGTPGRSGLTWTPAERGATRRSDDAHFARRLVQDLRARYEIDAMRIHAAGFSIGGSLVYEMASLRPDPFASIAVVGGAMIDTEMEPIRAMPLIHIHGMRDRYVPVDGGRGPATSDKNEWSPVQTAIETWRRANACTSDPRIDRTCEGVSGYCYEAGAADIELWLVEDCGHSWPGGRRERPDLPVLPETLTRFSATGEIWRFFAAHPRRRLLAPSVQRTLRR